MPQYLIIGTQGVASRKFPPPKKNCLFLGVEITLNAENQPRRTNKQTTLHEFPGTSEGLPPGRKPHGVCNIALIILPDISHIQLSGFHLISSCCEKKKCPMSSPRKRGSSTNSQNSHWSLSRHAGAGMTNIISTTHTI